MQAVLYRACDPTRRDVSPNRTDISVRSYGVFHPACPDEILLLALAKHVHFSRATQLLSDLGVFCGDFGDILGERRAASGER